MSGSDTSMIRPMTIQERLARLEEEMANVRLQMERERSEDDPRRNT